MDVSLVSVWSSFPPKFNLFSPTRGRQRAVLLWGLPLISGSQEVNLTGQELPVFVSISDPLTPLPPSPPWVASLHPHCVISEMCFTLSLGKSHPLCWVGRLAHQRNPSSCALRRCCSSVFTVAFTGKGKPKLQNVYSRSRSVAPL